MTWVGGPWAGAGLVVLPAGAGADDGRGGTGSRAPLVADSDWRPVGWSAETAGWTAVAGAVARGVVVSCRIGWRAAADSPSAVRTVSWLVCGPVCCSGRRSSGLGR